MRTHPQWIAVQELMRTGRIGELRVITGFFSYFNRDIDDIGNNPEYGGGGLMDIGCYPIFISRFIFGEEPRRVVSLIEKDPKMNIDRITSAILDFPSGQATFTCSTQLVSHQRMQFFGTCGRIEVEIPFSLTDKATRIFIDDGSDLHGKNIEIKEFAPINQYTIQGDTFSKAIREGGDPIISLKDSFNNMAVIDALFRSANSEGWETP